MGDHVRTQIRDAAVALLDDLATTGTRCHGGRPRKRPVQADTDLPCLLVYTNETETEMVAGQMGARRKANACQLVVHGYAEDSDDVDALLDTISKEVEAALEAAPTLGGLAKDLYLTSTVKESADDAKKPLAEVVLTFTVEFHTREGVPDAALA